MPTFRVYRPTRSGDERHISTITAPSAAHAAAMAREMFAYAALRVESTDTDDTPFIRDVSQYPHAPRWLVWYRAARPGPVHELIVGEVRAPDASRAAELVRARFPALDGLTFSRVQSVASATAA